MVSNVQVKQVLVSERTEFLYLHGLSGEKSEEIQCGAVIMRSIVSKILTTGTSQLAREGELWGVCCDSNIWFTFCHCRSALSYVLSWWIRRRYNGTWLIYFNFPGWSCTTRDNHWRELSTNETMKYHGQGGSDGFMFYQLLVQSRTKLEAPFTKITPISS